MIDLEKNAVASPSYFWSCITLSDECPFYSTRDPNLGYFGIVVMLMYVAFFVSLLIDLSFNWSMDKLYLQSDRYVHMVRKKVQKVQSDQRRLVSTLERTEKQLDRSQKCKKTVTSLRSALTLESPDSLRTLTGNMDDPATCTAETWTDITNVIDF